MYNAKLIHKFGFSKKFIDFVITLSILQKSFPSLLHQKKMNSPSFIDDVTLIAKDKLIKSNNHKLVFHNLKLSNDLDD